MNNPRLVKDIFPGIYPSSPNSLTAVGRNLYFTANNGVNGYELWRSDGSTAGTVQVADIDPDFDGVIDIGRLTALGSTLYFAARDTALDLELWKSDGTKSGTVLVADIWPGRFGSTPYNLTPLGNTLFFTAIDGGPSGYGGPRELWKSNGTAAGTVRITNFKQGFGGVGGGLTVLSGTLFFVADDGVNGLELWKSDGTAAGTRLVKDIDDSSNGYVPGNSVPGNFTVVGNTLFFTAEQNFSRNLWRSDGTSAGTVRLTNFSADIKPEGLTAVGNTLFFVAGGELWRSDGSESGTVQVKDIRTIHGNSDPVYLTAVGNTLYFSADDGTSGRELWKSDGTPDGTVRVADIEPPSGGFPVGSFPSNLTAVGDELYFTAETRTTGRELWRTDGTVSGTVRIADIRSGSYGSYPEGLTAVGRNLFFSADNGKNGRELYFLDLAPPSLISIGVEGHRLILGFSESIEFSDSIADRFAVTVDGASRSVTVSAGATSSELRLTLAGAAPTGSQTVRVNYTDLSGGNDERGVIQDGEGNDMVNIAAPGRAADTFRSSVSVTALAGTTTNLVLIGSKAINGMGNTLANTITGNGSANKLNGGVGADRLNGGGGKDTLTGGLDSDLFRFDSALKNSPSQDVITDFNRSEGDRIELENAVFKGLARTGTLSSRAFHTGSSFTNGSQRILYNPDMGHLSYDSNGNAAGGISTLIAVLINKPILTNSMLIVA